MVILMYQKYYQSLKKIFKFICWAFEYTLTCLFIFASFNNIKSGIKERNKAIQTNQMIGYINFVYNLSYYYFFKEI